MSFIEGKISRQNLIWETESETPAQPQVTAKLLLHLLTNPCELRSLRRHLVHNRPKALNTVQRNCYREK